MNNYKRLDTIVIWISDKEITNKRQLKTELGLKKGNHYKDGDKIWHADDVPEIVWAQIKQQKGHFFTDSDYCPPKAIHKSLRLSNYLSLFLEDTTLWLTKGLHKCFSVSVNDAIFSKLLHRNTDEMFTKHRRNKVVACASISKDELDWNAYDGTDESRDADLAIKTSCHELQTTLQDAANKLYYDWYNKGKSIYLLEFRYYEELADCPSVWKNVEHYYLGADE